MIKRDYSADYINLVANHPSVRGGAKIDLLDAAADFSLLVANTDNLVLTFPGGCFLLMNEGGGIYEVHTMALKEGRGPTLRTAVCEMLDYLFSNTDCTRLNTLCFRDNPLAMRLAAEFMTKDTESDTAVHYRLMKEEWLMRRAA